MWEESDESTPATDTTGTDCSWNLMGGLSVILLVLLMTQCIMGSPLLAKARLIRGRDDAEEEADRERLLADRALFVLPVITRGSTREERAEELSAVIRCILDEEEAEARKRIGAIAAPPYDPAIEVDIRTLPDGLAQALAWVRRQADLPFETAALRQALADRAQEVCVGLCAKAEAHEKTVREAEAAKVAEEERQARGGARSEKFRTC